MLCACGGNKYDKEAAGIIKMAQKEFEAKHYNRAILLIDSMRTHFPQAIETRKLALELYNNVSFREMLSLSFDKSLRVSTRLVSYFIVNVLIW